MRHEVAMAALALLWPTGAALAATPPALAVAPFAYHDTSGETRDQRGIHAERLARFDATLRQDLLRSGAFRLVPLPCPSAGCPDAADLAARARAAGATLLLLGGIHKMSTLVQFARLEIVDVESGRVTFNRLYTFRGDTETAWRHAETFIARDAAAQGGR